jgi:uncharacterized phiE125 gp8 family phage protein
VPYDELLPVSPDALGLGWWRPRHWRDVRKSEAREIGNDENGPEPLTLGDARTHLNIDANDFDDWIEAAIPAVRRQVEADLGGRRLVPTTLEMVFDQFPIERAIEIVGAITSVTSISSFAIDDTETVFNAANYIVDMYSSPGRVMLKVGQVWPTGLRPYLAGKIRWTAQEPVVFENWVHAMKLLLGHFFEHREAVASGVVRYTPDIFPLGYLSLLENNALVAFG